MSGASPKAVPGFQPCIIRSLCPMLEEDIGADVGFGSGANAGGVHPKSEVVKGDGELDAGRERADSCWDIEGAGGGGIPRCSGCSCRRMAERSL